MTDIDGKIAAAQAFLKAGNTRLALKYVEDAVAESERDPQALEVYCATLLALKRFAEMEKVALDWLARNPMSIGAACNLIGSRVRLGKKKEARAALAALREARPEAEITALHFQNLIESTFGDKAAGFERESALHGDTAFGHKMASFAAHERYDLSEAIREGEIALKMGEDAASFFSYFATIHYRAFKFAKARDYARMALKKQPGMAIPTELLILTRLVFFPPFFFAHLFVWMWFEHQRFQSAVRKKPLLLLTGFPALAAKTSGAALIIPLLIPFLCFVSERFGVDPLTSALVFAGCMFVFSVYSSFIGVIARLAGTERPELRVMDY